MLVGGLEGPPVGGCGLKAEAASLTWKAVHTHP